ncbi:multidrug transporter [Rhodovarius crocodyli]|uniref:Multidrug transporter n=1 Tax=Rhodovarius crocodyli TaxID=1979269 RepID=A0A437MPA4_9PROT|nr:SapC family protein [Rhodovarius crocodyli]RVT99472.1 multidrug transporter [Rhodovarius crocodyli]
MTGETTLLPSLYRALEPVTPERHGTLRLRDAGYGFAAELAAVPVAQEEMAVAGRHHPVVFTAEAPHMPVAIMGLTPGRNPHVGPDGSWPEGLYIPAYLRRYPFFLARLRDGAEDMALCLDPTAAQLSGEGEPLFEAGKPAPALDKAFAFTRDLERAMQRTRTMCEALNTLGLLQPAAVQFQRDGQPTKIEGFRAIQKEAFSRLDGAQLTELRDKGYLEAVYAHLFSMAELPKMAAIAA